MCIRDSYKRGGRRLRIAGMKSKRFTIIDISGSITSINDFIPSMFQHFLKMCIRDRSIPFDTCLTYYIMAGDAEVYFHSFSPSVQNN